MLTFNDELHEYRWDGVVVPSVTQILSTVGSRDNQSSAWHPVGGSDFCHNETAAAFGTAFHRVAELLVQGRDVRYPIELEPWVSQFRRFVDEWELEPVAVEKLMYSRRGYAGTVDFYGKSNAHPEVIIDWKTATTFQKYWRNQTAAYEKCIQEELGIRRAIPRVSVQFLENDFKIDVRNTNTTPADWNLFQSSLNVWKLTR